MKSEQEKAIEELLGEVISMRDQDDAPMRDNPVFPNLSIAHFENCRVGPNTPKSIGHRRPSRFFNVALVVIFVVVFLIIGVFFWLSV